MVNEAITDHAGHIDHLTARLGSFHSVMASGRPRHDQLGKDVVEVMTRVQTNDDKLKEQVASCVQLFDDEIDKMKGIHTVAQKRVVILLDGKVREMEASIQALKAAASS